MRRAAIALLPILSFCPFLWATDRYATPGTFGARMAEAVAGDRVILAPGTYGSYWMANKNGAVGAGGSPDRLIQVVAQDPANPPVFHTSSSECLQIASCTYMLFDGIVVQGATVEGIHLQSAGGPFSNHIIMRNCTVTMAVGGGNTDNWKSDYTTNTLFYNCRANTSADCGFDFVGCHDSLIMRCTMTNNGNSGVHAKSNSYNFGFYKNTFDNAGERSLQFGGNGPYSYDEVAMGNLLKGSPYAVAFTTVRYCDFRYNTIQNPSSAVIRILNENPGGGVTTAYNTFARNPVQYACSTWASGPDTQPATFTFADNFWSKTPSLPAPETGTVVGNPRLNAELRPLNPAAKDYGAHAPGMEDAWDAYTGRFAWAWAYANTYDPDAEAGGDYKVYKHGSLGGSATLDGGGSYAGNNPNAVSLPGLPALPNYHQNVIGSYSWDLNGDNVFGDATGETPAVTYVQLVGWGRGAVGTYTIELAITVDTDYDDIKDWDTARLVVAEAHAGDATFDGLVDYRDLGVLASRYDTSSGATWTMGDFNDDGGVDYRDLGILATNYDWVDGGGAVPEPAALALLALGGPALIRRRRN